MFDKLKNKLKGSKKKSNTSHRASSSDRKRTSPVQGSGRYKKRDGHSSS